MKKILFLLQLIIICNLYAQKISYHRADIFEKFKGKKLKIDGYNYYVEILGKGEPIFFLPGGPGNSHDYMQGNFGQYYQTNKVVFFDWLGRGKSDNAKSISEYSVEQDIEIIEKLRKKLGFDKIALVGHSYGTVPAQGYAIKYKQNVSKLMLISGFHSGLMWQANCDSYNHYSKTHFPEKWKKVDSIRNLGFVSSDKEHQKIYASLPAKYIYYHNLSLNQNVPKENFRGWSNHVYKAIIGKDGDFHVSGSMIGQDYRKYLKDVTAKTLIIAGRYDGVSTPEFAVQYKYLMPKARFEMFENSAHNPYLEEPKKFYKMFEEFMQVK